VLASMISLKLRNGISDLDVSAGMPVNTSATVKRPRGIAELYEPADSCLVLFDSSSMPRIAMISCKSL